MKKNIWKWILMIGVGAGLCHLKMFACYPLLAAWFVAVYMEEDSRSIFVPFMYLWMFLWLPIVDLGRYGFSLLVWMVVVAIFQRLGICVRRLSQSVLAGMILVGVNGGGMVLSVFDKRDVILAIFEGMFVSGMGFLVNPLIAWFLQWNPIKKKGAEKNILPQVQNYSMAMSGLAKSIERMVQPAILPKFQDSTALGMELRHRICVPCEQYSLCFGEGGEMSLVMEELLHAAKKGSVWEEELQKKIYTQCQRAEVLIREAESAFEKLELNESWYRRLCENREMIAGQIDAMAQVMGDCMEEEQLCDDKENWRLLQIKYHLRERGVKVSNLHCYRKKNGACRLSMDLATRRGNCVLLRDVLEELNHCGSEVLVSIEKNRTIVGREKENYTFVTKPKLVCDYGVAKMIQEGQEVSGDSFRAGQCVPGHFVMALSDGMGSGSEANRESEMVVDLLFQFARSGFAMDVTLRLMNAAMIFGADRERFSTLDVCLVDEYTGIVDFYKVGAHVSYIKHKKSVEVVSTQSLPMGAAGLGEQVPQRGYLEPGDCLVMLSDGVLEYLHVEDPVEMLRSMIDDMEFCDGAIFSRKLMERIFLFTGGRLQDDMTILTLQTEER